jgi:CBS domain-containing protein
MGTPPHPGTRRAPYFDAELPPAVANATVGDAMRHGVLTCRPDTPMRHIARMMVSNGVHAVLVRGAGSGQRGGEEAWSVVSDLDVARAAGRSARGEDVVAANACGPALTADPSEHLTDAARRMADRHASHLLVLEPETGEPVGVISALDVAAVWAWGLG